VGRPFLVRGRERLAGVARGSDWSTRGPTPDVNAIPADIRADLADRWMRIGLMEHASIAAFARFALQLLAIGAPPDLVREAQQAMGDETEHARLAFRLASVYARHTIGPSVLDITGALDGFCVEQLVATLVREGCIGETVAAIEAREALEWATDPAVREVLAIVARDELRHAQLAWRTLSWLVASGRVRAETVLQESARAFLEALSISRAEVSERELLEHGIVEEATRNELRRDALGIVATCLRGVLDTPASSMSAAVS
jgi:hypothetical protein